MTWRQSSISYPTSSDPITQISQLRLQNTRYKLQLQKLKKQHEPLTTQLSKQSSKLLQFSQKQQKLRTQLIRISILVNYNNSINSTNTQMFRINQITQLLDIIQKKIIQNKQHMLHIQKQYEKITYQNMKYTNSANISQNNNNQKLLIKEKQLQGVRRLYQEKCQQIKGYMNKLNQMNKQVNKKDQVITQLQYKLNLIQNEKRQSLQQTKQLRELQHQLQRDRQLQNQRQRDLNNLNINLNTEQKQKQELKRQCEQLLNFINVRDDDYLKSFLLKNCRFQNNHYNSSAKKNKYDFIFQN